MKKIIYISSVMSKTKNSQIMRGAKDKPLQSIQKFHRLLCEGISLNGIEIKTISAIPMSRKILKKIFWNEKREYENGVEYTYVPFVNIKIIRQLCILICTICKVAKEAIKRDDNKIFICDILNTTISSVTLILSKIFKFKCIAIVTDLPRDIGKKSSISRKINEALQNKFDGYVLFTEYMNDIVNPTGKPYIIIEGIADKNMKDSTNELQNKYKEKVCIYAGGLYQKYGVKNLIEAFKLLQQKDIKLFLFGSGELEDYIRNINDERIKYFGVIENEKIVDEEIKATLLINPRFTHEEYTKYSFPSKNMEYMASGTPVLTTKLPGMPKEYYDYIYCFEDESVEGMRNKLEKVLSMDVKELHQRGQNAKKFVLDKKNNVIQARKIIKFLGDSNDEFFNYTNGNSFNVDS